MIAAAVLGVEDEATIGVANHLKPLAKARSERYQDRHQESRVVQNDWTVSSCNRIFQLSEQHQKLGLTLKKILVSELLDGTLRLTYRGRTLSWAELTTRPARPRKRSPTSPPTRDRILTAVNCRIFDVRHTRECLPDSISKMPDNLLTIVETTTLDFETASAKTRHIHAELLQRSPYINNPNFTRIHPSDLKILFDHYDEGFFGGQIQEALGATPLCFGLSQRMTSSGGKTSRMTSRATKSRLYEISVSMPLLFGCFAGDDHRPIKSSGITCHDRLDALQRVMEHEIVHLIEMLLWDESSCSLARFHSITRRFFGHTENKHQLITPREKAMVKYGIKQGSRVKFTFEGIERTGVVNRISKRATVLVEDQRGQQYSDGKHYAKFYVPVHLLEAVD